MEKIAVIVVPNQEGLQPVFTIPSARRLVLLIRQAGIATIHFLGRIHPHMSVIMSDFVHSEDFHPVGDPAEIPRILDGIGAENGQRVLVAKADTIVDRLSLSRLLSADDGDHLFFMQAEGENAAEGIYMGDTKDLISIVSRIWPELPPAGKSDAHIIRVPGTTGLPYSLDRKPDAAASSEDRLIAALSAQTEASDGFLARHIDRRISRFFSKRLSRTRIKPNQITLIGVATGLFGAFLLSRTGYWAQLAGAFLFLFCVVVDGVDGEVARLKIQESRFGHYLDIITDNLVHVAVFTGIALGLYRDGGQAGYLHALGFLMGGFILCAVAVYDCILRRRSTGTGGSTKTLRLMALMSNRDFAYLLVLLAAAHRLAWFLVGAAVGSYLFAAALWGARYFEKRAVSSQSG